MASDESAEYLTVMVQSKDNPLKQAKASVKVEEERPVPVHTYTLTVVNGSGSGNYEEGETARIKANIPESGMRFDCWKVMSIFIYGWQPMG